jgi:hypothetical protein
MRNEANGEKMASFSGKTKPRRGTHNIARLSPAAEEYSPDAIRRRGMTLVRCLAIEIKGECPDPSISLGPVVKPRKIELRRGIAAPCLRLELGSGEPRHRVATAE